MEVVLLGLALGAGALFFAKRGRPVAKAAVGWTARKTGFIASRVQASIDRTKAVAREEYERGRAEAWKEARSGTVLGGSQADSPASPNSTSANAAP
jgi:hypothetical protein